MIGLFTETRMAKIREHGLAHVVADGVRRRIYNQKVSVFFKRDLSPLKRRYRLSEGIVVRHAPDLDEVACQRHFASHWQVYARLLRNGCIPFAAFHNNDVVAITWWSESDYYDADVYKYRFLVGPQQIYQFAGELAKPYRRRASAIPAAMLDVGWAFFREHGKRGVFAITDVENTISIRLHLYTGFKEAGRKLVTHKLLGWSWSREEPYDGSITEHAVPRRRRIPGDN